MSIDGRTDGPWSIGQSYDPDGNDPRVHILGKNGEIVARNVKPDDARMIVEVMNCLWDDSP